MNKPKHILIIDDDPINNFLCCEIIHNLLSDVPLNDFTSPEKGLEYISNFFAPHGDSNSIFLFLDINMPTMSGWEFMDQFNLLPNGLKEQFRVSILSSSVDPADKNRAASHSRISGFIEKPLTKSRLESLLFE